MLRVERHRMIETASPEDIFRVLSNTEGLTRLLPRLRKAELHDENETSARLVLHISIGSMFGTVRFDGSLQWVEPREITLRIRNPLPADVVWHLTPQGFGTRVGVTISMNLDPLLGPMKHFIPVSIVEEMIGKDLDHSLKEVSARLEPHPSPSFCPIPQFCTVQPGFAF